VLLPRRFVGADEAAVLLASSMPTTSTSTDTSMQTDEAASPLGSGNANNDATGMQDGIKTILQWLSIFAEGSPTGSAEEHLTKLLEDQQVNNRCTAIRRSVSTQCLVVFAFAFAYYISCDV
jgi:hypothetical protein